MKEHYSRILIQFRPQLVDEIEPIELLNQLLSRSVLTKRQAKSIACLHDPYKQNEEILDALHRRPDADFDKFCEALMATGQESIVESYLKPIEVAPAASAGGEEQETTSIVTDERAQNVAGMNVVHKRKCDVEGLGIELRESCPDDVDPLDELAIVSTRLCGVDVVTEQPVDQLHISEQLVVQPHIPEQLVNQPLAVNNDDDDADDWKKADRPMYIDGINVVECLPHFYNQYKDASYPMNTVPRGIFLLICNKQFANVTSGGESHCSMRQGADVDATNLSELFRQLHFNVLIHENLKAKEMLQLVKETSYDPSLSTSQCFAMCIMSHGKLTVATPGQMPVDESLLNTEVVFGSDAQTVSTMSLLTPFADEHCAMLRGKPRIVLFQACRGESVDKSDCEVDDTPTVTMATTNTGGITATTTDAELDESSYAVNRPVSLKDFIIGYPTQSGFRSFRNTTVGSWYINALTRVFAKHACDTEVSAMLRMVNSYVSKWVSNCDHPQLNRGTQVASTSDNLTRQHLYLFPGIKE